MWLPAGYRPVSSRVLGQDRCLAGVSLSHGPSDPSLPLLGMERLSDRLTRAVAAPFVVPAMTSPRAGLWVAGYRVLQAPLVTVGSTRRYRAALEWGDVRILCVGRLQRFGPLLTRVFGGRAELEEMCTRWPPWRADRLWPADADLVAAEIHPSLARRLRAAGWLICPELVRYEGALSEIPPSGRNRSLRSDLIRVAEGGFTLCEAPGSKHDWEEFKRAMLVPYARRRFGEQVSMPSPRLLRAVQTHGKLLFVIKDGRRLAGACVLCTGDEVWLAALGVRGGDITLVREGVLAALYALTIDWARGIGMRRINAGRCSAFQRDGIAQYKRKWGLSPVREPLSNLVAIRVDPTSRALRLAMEREPFFVEGEDGRLELYPASSGS
jgi:hypothetical protein